jgi:hypothetical protein
MGIRQWGTRPVTNSSPPTIPSSRPIDSKREALSADGVHDVGEVLNLLDSDRIRVVQLVNDIVFDPGGERLPLLSAEGVEIPLVVEVGEAFSAVRARIDEGERLLLRRCFGLRYLYRRIADILCERLEAESP